MWSVLCGVSLPQIWSVVHPLQSKQYQTWPECRPAFFTSVCCKTQNAKSHQQATTMLDILSENIIACRSECTHDLRNPKDWACSTISISSSVMSFVLVSFIVGWCCLLPLLFSSLLLVLLFLLPPVVFSISSCHRFSCLASCLLFLLPPVVWYSIQLPAIYCFSSLFSSLTFLSFLYPLLSSHFHFRLLFCSKQVHFSSHQQVHVPYDITPTTYKGMVSCYK